MTKPQQTTADAAEVAGDGSPDYIIITHLFALVHNYVPLDVAVVLAIEPSP